MWAVALPPVSLVDASSTTGSQLPDHRALLQLLSCPSSRPRPGTWEALSRHPTNKPVCALSRTSSQPPEEMTSGGHKNSEVTKHHQVSLPGPRHRHCVWLSPDRGSRCSLERAQPPG